MSLFMLNSNVVTHIMKLTNQSMLNGALLIEMVNNSLSESYKNFDRWIKQGTF